MTRLPRLPFALLALAAAATAQAQWLVGAGGYAQIRDVMPFVAAGDTVTVGPGVYHPFTCSEGITLRAATPGTVTVAWSFFSMPQPCGCTCMSLQGPVRFAVPAGQTAHVVGIAFAGVWQNTPCFSVIQQTVAVSGRTTFDQCAIDCLTVDGASVHLQDCTVTSVADDPAIAATDGNVTIVGGSVTGASAGAFGQPPSPAIAATASRLHASGVTVNGGAASATAPGAPGIVANGGSLWLADSTVTAGGGCAVSATGVVRIDRSTLNGSGASCAVSPTGAPLVGVDRNGPITIGQVFQVTIASEPNALVLVHGATRLSAPIEVAGLIEQPAWIDPATLFLADATVAGASGQTTFAYPVPAIPALAGAQFWLQGVGGTAFPLQTSPVVGGVVR